MQDLGPAHEQEMLAAFLRAEVDSPRFGAGYRGILDRLAVDRTALLERPDVTDPLHNRIRTEMLKAGRGWQKDSLLFAGFPADTVWTRVSLEPADQPRLRYANHAIWVNQAGGSRRVDDGARRALHGHVPEIPDLRPLAERMRAGAVYPELIVVEGRGDTLVLVEGHSRATAWLMSAVATPFPALLGRSPAMAGWALY